MADLAYIYLLQDGKDVGSNVYKVGRTLQKGGDGRKLNRLQCYSEGTIPSNTWRIKQVHMLNDIEDAIKTIFRKEFCLVRGSEWFEGDVDSMKKSIDGVIERMDIKTMKSTETKRKWVSDPYTCPRCAYQTSMKIHMRDHLYKRNNQCPANTLDIELTDHIKSYILQNRIYRPPPIQTKTKSSIINYKEIHYIIKQFDPVSKVKKITAYKETPLISLTQHTTDVFMNRVQSLNSDEVKLTKKNLMDFLDELTIVKRVDRMNILYDKQLDCVMGFENGCWNKIFSYKLPHTIIQNIKDTYLDLYECYLLGKMYGPEANPDARTEFQALLEEYYRFIYAFDMEPCVKSRSNAAMHSQQGDVEAMELFAKSTAKMRVSDVRRTVKEAEIVILGNCKLIVRDLDKQIKDCMSTDPDFYQLMVKALTCDQ